MKENKTKQTVQSVEDFIASLTNDTMREDCKSVMVLMQDLTQDTPKMWGASIVGFSSYQYHYTSGRQGEWFKIGFSPRKQNLTLYISAGFEQHTEILARLGKHTIGKSCLYIKKLANIDIEVLKELLLASL